MLKYGRLEIVLSVWFCVQISEYTFILIQHMLRTIVQLSSKLQCPCILPCQMSLDLLCLM